MICSIHNYYTTTITPKLHRDPKEHFLTEDQCLADQNPSDCEPDCRWEPPVDLDREEAAYEVWQASLSYLIEDIERI